MAVNIQISLNDKLYLRDPQDSELGRKIIKNSILLIEKIGFEAFTFRKLANEISSTEASIYRYFENKHMLLVYLVSWYWEWVSYLIEIKTLNLDDPQRKLEAIINTFVSASKENPAIEYVNESSLHNIIISESTKAYHTKEVDSENKDGLFLNYKDLVARVSDVIKEINPKFPYPCALASSLFEMTNNHIYFAEHLPRLTDIGDGEAKYDEAENMLKYFVGKLLS